VPWHGIDVFAVFAFDIALVLALCSLAGPMLGVNVHDQAPMSSANDSSNEHAVFQLLSSGSPWMLLICLVSAVLVAPIYEEFFFRILLQGWLESAERRSRRWLPWLHHGVSVAFLPIMATSFLFASQHVRTTSPTMAPIVLAFCLAANSLASLTTLGLATVWLRWRVGATAVDFGWQPKKFLSDVVLGVTTFLVVGGPLYGLQIFLKSSLPDSVAPDPIPLFFFAIVLGFLTFRTHRIMPAIILHASLNATSLAMALLLLRK
jgi:membrane protease YdiL (CAAX protease family)